MVSKKVLIIALVCAAILLVLLLLALGSLLLFEKDKEEFIQQTNLIGAGLSLIQLGKYEEGLNQCDLFNQIYTMTICYQAALTLMKKNDEKIDLSFCDRIPTSFKSNLPLTLKISRFFEKRDYNKQFEKESLKLKEDCLASVS